MLSIFLKRFLISQIIYTCRAGFSRGAKWKQGDGSKDSNTVLELVVCVGSALDEKQVKDIKWPKHCLLIKEARGREARGRIFCFLSASAGNLNCGLK